MLTCTPGASRPIPPPPSAPPNPLLWGLIRDGWSGENISGVFLELGRFGYNLSLCSVEVSVPERSLLPQLLLGLLVANPPRKSDNRATLCWQAPPSSEQEGEGAGGDKEEEESGNVQRDSYSRKLMVLRTAT